MPFSCLRVKEAAGEIGLLSRCVNSGSPEKLRCLRRGKTGKPEEPAPRPFPRSRFGL